MNLKSPVMVGLIWVIFTISCGGNNNSKYQNENRESSLPTSQNTVLDSIRSSGAQEKKEKLKNSFKESSFEAKKNNENLEIEKQDLSHNTEEQDLSQDSSTEDLNKNKGKEQDLSQDSSTEDLNKNNLAEEVSQTPNLFDEIQGEWKLVNISDCEQNYRVAKSTLNIKGNEWNETLLLEYQAVKQDFFSKIANLFSTQTETKKASVKIRGVVSISDSGYLFTHLDLEEAITILSGDLSLNQFTLENNRAYLEEGKMIQVNVSDANSDKCKLTYVK